MVDKCEKAAASHRGKKSPTSRKADKAAQGKEVYSMRCVPCSLGHRLCTRTKPCSICVNARRTCTYPPKATLVKAKSDEEAEDDGNEEEDKESDEEDDHYQEAAAPDAEMSPEPLVVSSQPEQNSSFAPRSYQNPAWNVAMHFARAQVLHEAEAMAADPTRGYINPRIRPDLDPSYAGPSNSQPSAQQASTIGDIGNNIMTQNVGGTLNNSDDSNDNEARDSTTHQPLHEDEEEEPYRNEAKELMDDFEMYYGDYGSFTGGQANDDYAAGGLNDNGQPKNGNEAQGGQQEILNSFDQADPMDSFFIPLPAFENNGPYTVADCSATHLCNERRTHWMKCNNPCTYPCQEDHRFLEFETHHVCHDCRVEPALYSVSEEESMIAALRLYMCAECTQIRVNGPEEIIWTHPRREPETKKIKVNKCSCHEQLQKGWICEEHRILAANRIRMWGPEDIKAFRGFFGGNVCSNCRTTKLQEDGLQDMWQCAHCKDIVVKG